MVEFSKRITVLCLAAALWIGCTDVGEYSTDSGECYDGKIVDSEFVRMGFEKGTGLLITLDADALGHGDESAVVLTTTDGRFDKTPATQMEMMSHDSLSMLQFPGGRVRNYLAFAEPDGMGTALVVVSLMENEYVEVRILRPGEEDGSGMFGVFRLVRKDGCGT